MKILTLLSDSGIPKKAVNILKFDGGLEILTHYGRAIAGFQEDNYIKTDEFHSITSSKNINLYIGNVEAEVVSQEYLDDILNNVSL